MVYDNFREDIYDKYITEWYGFKNAEDAKPENERNDVLREICKLFMNALYGKMLQRSYFESEIIVNNTKEIYDFGKDHYITNIELIGSGKVLLNGTVKEINEDNEINKPSQFGAFVSSYSRRLMNTYNKIHNPKLKELTITYRDTDSMHMYGENYNKLNEMGLIKTELRYLANDIKDGNGLIIQEINLGSKLYMYKYINNKNEIKTTMKTKGLPQKYLQQKFFIERKGEVIINGSFKKTFTKLNGREKSKNIDIFTIRKEDIKRSFNKNAYDGRELREDGLYYPWGYKGEEIY